MSEFKYACPVCGQHIKCDSSQAGTQMECPTCFQKIIVPQAPSEEQKFILTGTQVGGERPLPTAPEANPYTPRPGNGLSGAVVVFIILACIVGAVGYVYRGTIFKGMAKEPPVHKIATAPNPPPKKPSPPPLIAPPANDTNWTLALKGVAIPQATAAGRIEGQNFICDHATFQGGYLTLHDGNFSFTINFGGATADMLARKTINVTTNAASAARVILRWKDGDQTLHETFTNDYAMRLDFEEATNNRIAGKIYLCTSDEKKSYVAGTFKADIRKSRPKKQ